MMFALVVILVFLVVYFVPTFVAYGRQHHNRLPIFIANLFFGVTIIGYVIILIWSLTAVQRQGTPA